MTTSTTDRRYLHWVDTGDGSRYPKLIRNNESDSLEWLLRYGSPEDLYEVRYQAASILAAYEALVMQSNARRNEIANRIKKAPAP